MNEKNRSELLQDMHFNPERLMPSDPESAFVQTLADSPETSEATRTMLGEALRSETSLVDMDNAEEVIKSLAEFSETSLLRDF